MACGQGCLGPPVLHDRRCLRPVDGAEAELPEAGCSEVGEWLDRSGRQDARYRAARSAAHPWTIWPFPKVPEIV